MDTAKTADPPARKRGRPAGSKYDAEVVRDISEQVMVAFYNSPAGQVVLRKRLADDPGFADKVRAKAVAFDAIVRVWLDVLSYVPRNHKHFKREAAFRFWCARLEPPYTPKELKDRPEKEAELRGIYIKHCTDEHWEKNCKPWIDAIERVQQDRQWTLDVPVEEEDDEW